MVRRIVACVLLLMFQSTLSVDSVDVQLGCTALCALQPCEPVSDTGCICLRALLWPGCVQLCKLATYRHYQTCLCRLCVVCGCEARVAGTACVQGCRVRFKPCLFCSSYVGAALCLSLSERTVRFKQRHLDSNLRHSTAHSRNDDCHTGYTVLQLTLTACSCTACSTGTLA
jgi:predicted ATPase